jgi:hypothetical protein
MGLDVDAALAAVGAAYIDDGAVARRVSRLHEPRVLVRWERRPGDREGAR